MTSREQHNLAAEFVQALREETTDAVHSVSALHALVVVDPILNAQTPKEAASEQLAPVYDLDSYRKPINGLATVYRLDDYRQERADTPPQPPVADHQQPVTGAPTAPAAPLSTPVESDPLTLAQRLVSAAHAEQPDSMLPTEYRDAA